MKRVFIDRQNCIGCRRCEKDCVAGCIKVVDAKADIDEASCIGCGHCYAVCPTGAVVMPEAKADEGELRSFSEIDSRLLLQAMKSRRSIRRFTSRSVEGEKLNMILEAGRYSPTAANAQDVAFTVLGSKQTECESICVQLFRKAAEKLGKVSEYVRKLEIDDNFFFKGAPLVIVVSAKNTGNADLAAAYMEIMAESLGLGVLYSGFFIACTRLSGKLRKLLKLPKGHKAAKCLVIGYSAVNYRRIPPRKELKLRRL